MASVVEAPAARARRRSRRAAAGERLVDAFPGLEALRERDFRVLLGAQWTSLLGDAMLLAALPFAVFAIGGSASHVGLAFAANALSLTALLLAGGVAGDRLAQRTVLIAADCVRAAAQIGIGVLLVLGEAQLWHLIAAQAVLGAGAAFALPALTGLVPQTVDDERLQGASALRGLGLSSAGIAGPAIAAAVVVGAGAGWAFVVDGATFLVSALLVARLRAGGEPGERGEPVMRQLLEGWWEFRRRTWVWVVVCQFALVNAFVLAPFYVLGAAVAAESLGGAGAWAAILAGSGAGALAGGVVALRWQPSRPLLVATAIVAVWALPLALLAASAPLAALVPAAFLAGGSLAVFGALWESVLQRNVPPAQLCRVSSYDCLGSLAFLPLGYAVAGPLAEAVGLAAMLGGGAVLAVASSAVVMRLAAVRGVGARAPSRAFMRPAASNAA